MAVVFLDERPSMQEWIGLGLVTAGVLTLALKRKKLGNQKRPSEKFQTAFALLQTISSKLI